MGKDPLQNVDETVPGFIADPSTYSEPTPGGKRRARTFSQAIADATRGADAGMNRFTPTRPDLSSSAYRPDYRGQLSPSQKKPVPRAALQLETEPESEIHLISVEDRERMNKAAPNFTERLAQRR